MRCDRRWKRGKLMRRVTLSIPAAPQSCTESSVLGFGCVNLTTHRRVSSALELMEDAFAHGITHYDVAPLYGYGQAEGILGRFLQGKRDRVTVTTKIGLPPYPSLARHRRLISLGRRMTRQLPAVRRVLGRVLARPGHAASPDALEPTSPARLNSAFDPDQAARSLETSLRELKTDYLDILLLHECTLADARREDLVRFLDDQVRAGKIRCYGIGTAFANLRTGVSTLPPGYRVLQFENNPLTPNVSALGDADGRAVITHTALAPYARLLDAARSDPDVARRHGEPAGLDLGDPQALAAALLRYALACNPRGVVLLATMRREHLLANVAIAESQPLGDEQRSALELFARAALAPQADRGRTATAPGSAG